ncbi:hypothetical protein NMY22_g15960 [Coprinellus aureogranulatus]|nr:hypothetical protein NMY22_g15960 [Coprinellus aureogranulatus]
MQVSESTMETDLGSETCTSTTDGCPLIRKDLSQFEYGDLDRYLYHILRASGAIPPFEVDGKEVLRPGAEVVREGLQRCLFKVDEAVKQQSDCFNLIQLDFMNYAKANDIAERCQHFADGANRTLTLLERVSIEGCPAQLGGSRKRLQFQVHELEVIRDHHDGVIYPRQPFVTLSDQNKPIRLHLAADETTEVSDQGNVRLNHDVWEKGLMFVEFNERPSEALEPPASWNLQLGPKTPMARDAEHDLDGLEDEGQALLAAPSSGYSSAMSGGSATYHGHVQEEGTKKRSTLFTTEGPPLKKRRVLAVEREATKVNSTAVRLAEDAAESLHNAIGRDHVLGLAIVDANINIWRFDHESPVQMTGFNFLKDQHYLFLFLLALQRFNSRHWGFLPGFEKLISQQTFALDLTELWTDGRQRGERITFVGRKDDMVKPPYELEGHSTSVLFGSVDGRAGQQNVVLKLSWQETIRPLEKVFIDEARKRFDGVEEYNPCDFLPTILAAHEYVEFQSRYFREAVLQDEVDDCKRAEANLVPYLLVLPKYEPITVTTRNWDTFMAAFLALFYCGLQHCVLRVAPLRLPPTGHAMLWSVGIRHGGISDSSLMWDPATETPKLCNFESAQFCAPADSYGAGNGRESRSGKRFINPGTWQFMASDLLTGWVGREERVYGHDVESFIIVLVYIVCKYANGRLKFPTLLQEWNQEKYERIPEKRKDTFDGIIRGSFPRPPDVPEGLWATIQSTLAMSIQFSNLATAIRYRQMWKPIQGRFMAGDYVVESPEDLQTLRALPMILRWPLFNPSLATGKVFVDLIKKRIPQASYRRLPTTALAFIWDYFRSTRRRVGLFLYPMP